MNFFTGINYYAVVVSAIVYYMIGFVWYSLLFSEIWGKETGVSMKSQAKPQAGPLIGQFISTLLYTFGIAVILRLHGTYGIAAGICIAALVTILFVIPVHSGNLFFTGKKKLFLLDVCERAIGTLVAGIILGLWTNAS
jgi:hypothetical protein